MSRIPFVLLALLSLYSQNFGLANENTDTKLSSSTTYNEEKEEKRLSTAVLIEASSMSTRIDEPKINASEMMAKGGAEENPDHVIHLASGLPFILRGVPISGEQIPWVAIPPPDKATIIPVVINETATDDFDKSSQHNEEYEEATTKVSEPMNNATSSMNTANITMPFEDRVDTEAVMTSSDATTTELKTILEKVKDTGDTIASGIVDKIDDLGSAIKSEEEAATLQPIISTPKSSEIQSEFDPEQESTDSDKAINFEPESSSLNELEKDNKVTVQKQLAAKAAFSNMPQFLILAACLMVIIY